MKISNALTLEEVKNIIDRYEDHVYKDDIKYFVNEETELSKQNNEKGHFVDKFIVGISNRHTHFSISELKSYYDDNTKS